MFALSNNTEGQTYAPMHLPAAMLSIAEPEDGVKTINQVNGIMLGVFCNKICKLPSFASRLHLSPSAGHTQYF